MKKNYIYDKLKQHVAHMIILKKNIKQDIIELNKERAKQHLIDIILLVEEADYQNGAYSRLDLLVEILIGQYERLERVTQKEDLQNVLERITQLFEDHKYKDDLTTVRKYHYYRHSIEDCNATGTFSDLVTNERPIQFLSFDTPEIILDIKHSGAEKINSYGICITSSRYSEHLVRNVAHGIGNNSHITNNVFDIVSVMPDTSVSYTPIGFKNDIIPKQEYLTLTNCMRYLRTNGLIHLIMPYTRLDHELCTYLAKHFSSIQIAKLDDILIEIVGAKKEDKAFDADTYNQMRSLYRTFKSTPDTFSERYTLPRDSKEVLHFRGSRITDEMLAQAGRKSDAFDKLLDMAQFIDDITNHTPILPFNTGQIGLLLASGCLDGVVHEDDEHCHLIKGRVEKRVVASPKAHRGDNEEVRTYYSVQINALTPDGKLIEIS